MIRCRVGSKVRNTDFVATQARFAKKHYINGYRLCFLMDKKQVKRRLLFATIDMTSGLLPRMWPVVLHVASM